MSTDDPNDLLGLADALPCRGWTVLDAARDHRFTGELVAEADATFRVYLDRGRVYIAERATDPPLGVRLVEAGAINTAQLAYGTLHIGEIEHLGRLFDRVPSVNRDGVLVLNQLMTEECVRILAERLVTSITLTPYRHHPSGMHRWESSVDPVGSAVATADLALPAPPPDARPVTVDEQLVESTCRSTGASRSQHVVRAHDDGLLLDDLVEWDEPSRLAGGTTTMRRQSGAPTHDLLVADPARSDWAAHLGPTGLPDAPAEPIRNPLGPWTVRPPGQFEVIWPSGEADDLSDPTSDSPADHDRGGPTARLSSPEHREKPHDERRDERGDEERHEPGDETALPQLPPRSPATTATTTGSLPARRRVAATTTAPPPGRIMVGREHNTWRTATDRPTGSVFDEQPAGGDAATPVEPAPSAAQRGRAGALRRLIDNLRRS